MDIFSLQFSQTNENIQCTDNQAVLVKPGRYFPKIWVGVCGALLETLTLFHTKICNFPYPISDLTQNLIPYFRPDSSPISFV